MNIELAKHDYALAVCSIRRLLRLRHADSEARTAIKQWIATARVAQEVLS